MKKIIIIIVVLIVKFEIYRLKKIPFLGEYYIVDFEKTSDQLAENNKQGRNLWIKDKIRCL